MDRNVMEPMNSECENAMQGDTSHLNNAHFSDVDCKYLQMMQDNIRRMASNSFMIKNWTISIVTAALALGYKMDNIHHWLLLTLIPIFTFWCLDAYYLQLERKLRNRQQRFINIKKGLENESNKNDLFDFSTLEEYNSDKSLNYVKAQWLFFSKAVFPLYVILIIIVLFITSYINCWFSIFC